MVTPKRYCQAGLVTYPDGTQGILVGGDYNGVTSVEFLNLETLVWEPRQNLPIDVYGGASVPYQDSFLVVGGYQYNSDEFLDTIYYYNPNVDQWDLIANMEYSREFSTAFLVPDSYANCN